MIEQRLKGIPVVYELACLTRDTIRRVIGTCRLKRRLAKQPSRRIVVAASNRFGKGWIPTKIEFLKLLKSTDWDPADGPIRRVRRGAKTEDEKARDDTTIVLDAVKP